MKPAILADTPALQDRCEQTGLMEPPLVAEGSPRRPPLNDLAVELAQRAAGFRRSLPPGVLIALADLVRAMNCYYSNLIEGHDTHPVDIERALKNDYVNAILAGSPQAQLVESSKPKKIKGITPEAMARMEQELGRLQEGIASIQDTYGQDHLHLTVIKGYVGKLIGNARVVRYLAQTPPEFLGEFQTITEITPVEVANRD